MTDPSGKYAFDVNPGRQCDDDQCRHRHDLFVAHYVNDASFADFSPIVNAAKDLRKQQQTRVGSSSSNINSESDNGMNTMDDEFLIKEKQKELDAAAVRLAVDYYLGATGTRRTHTATAVPTTTKAATNTNTTTTTTVRQEGEDGSSSSSSSSNTGGFNVIMCGFGPPPLMAYVTTKPVQRGQEFLATYGLGYWLGKAFPDESDGKAFETARQALDANPKAQRAYEEWDDMVQDALDIGDAAIETHYRKQTKLISETFEVFRTAHTDTNTDTDTDTRSATSNPRRRHWFRRSTSKILAMAAACWKRR
mmetsp:Transcript_26259/g.55203  ORF Transcript_26259/g.55203 Transcript_26259/m.55203 type:complete len:307 (+) Transcript_26259:743-1663(+)